MRNPAFTIPFPLTAVNTSSGHADYPSSNLTINDPAEKWRSTTLTSVTVNIDLGSAKTFDTIAALYSNMTDVAQVVIKTADTEGGLAAGTVLLVGSANNFFAGAAVVGNPRHGYFPVASTTKRWIQLAFTDAANPDGYFQLGAIVVGAAYQPTYNRAYGTQEGYRTTDTITDMAVGGKLVNEGDIYPTLAMRLPWGTEEEARTQMRPLKRALGSTRPVLVCLDPDSAYKWDMVYFGRMKSLSPVVHKKFGIYETRISLEDLGSIDRG